MSGLIYYQSETIQVILFGRAENSSDRREVSGHFCIIIFIQTIVTRLKKKLMKQIQDLLDFQLMI
jgi:hypothetical protein